MKRHLVTLFTLGLSAGACQQVLGLDQFKDGLCKPGSTRRGPCVYSGPAGTEGVGICHAAFQTCADDGQSWGACEGEVTPKAESCDTPEDDNCDGEVNETGAGCCMPGEMCCLPNMSEACYSGPGGTAGVGICKAGTHTCDKEGKAFGPCVGEVVPAATGETCASTEDEDCDSYDCVMWAMGLGANGMVAQGFITAVAPAPDGGVVIAGSTSEPAQLGSTMLTVPSRFIAKLKADGSPEWVTEATGGNFAALSVDSAGNVYAAGTAQSDIQIAGQNIPVSQFVVKVGADGKVLWIKPMAGMPMAGAGGSPTSIVATADNAVVVAGIVLSTNLDLGDGPVPSAGTFTGYVAKLSAADGSGTKAGGGGKEWTYTYSAVKQGFVFYGPFVAATSANDVVAVFNFANTTTFAGQSFTSAGATDIGLLRLSPTGTPTAVKSYGDNQGQTALGLTIANGVIVFGGTYLGTINPVLGQPGSTLTAVSAPGALADVLYGDGFAIALDESSLNLRVAVGFDAPGHATGFGVDSQGGVVLAGKFSGTMDLGGGTLDGGQGDALLLAKFKPDGLLRWNRAFSHPSEATLRPLLAVAADDSEWVGGSTAVWPLDLGKGELNTSAHPAAAFVGHFAP